MIWLDEVLEATSKSETPRPFFYWGALCAIAAVVKKNVFMTRGGVYVLYPNLYVAFLMESGGRKSGGISLCQNLVKQVGNTRVIAGRASIEAIISKLSKAYTVEGHPPFTDASCLLIPQEFTTMLVSNPGALGILTAWYDTHQMAEWENELKSTGIEKLKNLCVTMLVASNQSHFKDTVKGADVEGGFLGRTLLIEETQRSQINSLIYDSVYDDIEGLDTEGISSIDYAKYGAYLKEIALLNGRFLLSRKAADCFDSWYQEHNRTKFEDPTGAVNRIADNILKTAMCLALAHKPELKIELPEIEEAMEKCLERMGTAKRIVVTGGGKASLDTETRKAIVRVVLASEDYKVKRADLLSKLGLDYDVSEIEKAVMSLSEVGWIMIVKGSRGTYYEALSGLIERFKNVQGGLMGGGR